MPLQTSSTVIRVSFILLPLITVGTSHHSFPASDFTFASVGERRKSKKCSVFHTITENVAVKDELFTEYSHSLVENKEKAVNSLRKKSSKKVSIAENLNCDYSDICDLNEETPLSSENEGNTRQAGDENTPGDLEENIDQAVQFGVEHLALDLVLFIFLSVLKIIHLGHQTPLLLTVILVILFFINFYFT